MTQETPWWAAREMAPEPEPTPEPETAAAPEPQDTPLASAPPALEASPPERTSEADEPAEPVASETPDETPERTPRRGPLVPALAVLVVVLLGLTGFLGWQAKDTAGAAPVEASRTEALSAAREAARLVFSYDYRRLDKDFAAGKAVITGEFAAEYARTTAKLVGDVAPRYKAVVAADVSDAAVVRAKEGEVVCLVFVNQTSTSSLATAPKITQSRLEMTLKRVGNRWKVAKIDAL